MTEGSETRIGLQLAQEDLAQLLGASRQRVNQELKSFERDGAVRVEPTRLVVLDSAAAGRRREQSRHGRLHRHPARPPTLRHRCTQRLAY